MMININEDYILKKVICIVDHINTNSEKKEVTYNDFGLISFENNLMFKNSKYICDIVVKENGERNFIREKLKQNCNVIASVVELKKSNTVVISITLDVYFFPTNKNFENLGLYFTNEILEKMIKSKIIKDFSDEELKKLKKNFIISDGYIKDEDVQDNDRNCFMCEVINNKSGDMINIYSKNNLMISTALEDDTLVVKNIEKISQNRPILSLGFGVLTFQTQKTLLASKTKELLSKNKGYIHSWDNYSNLEGDFLLERARGIGLIFLEKIEVNGANLILELTECENSKKALNSLSVDDQLVFTKEVPTYIELTDLNWVDYRDIIREDGKTNPKDANTTVTIIGINKATNSLIINNNGTDIDDKNLYLSYKIDGNEQQIVRREHARQSIIEGRSAMPQLGLILNGQNALNDVVDNNKKVNKDVSISGYVKDKVFPINPPTDNQLKAIEIALNTPDIAIIQGPPGTGKTTVITAIIERLNELFEKKSPFSDMSGQVLVTSFQHDAVENNLSLLSVNSLPSIKFGSRSRTSVEEYDMGRIMNQWCNTTLNNIKAKNIKLKKSQLQQKFGLVYENYRLYPNTNYKISFLELAQEIVENDTLLSQNMELQSKIKTKLTTENLDADDSNAVLSAVIRLRVTYESFKDDGRLQSRKVHELLKPLTDFTKEKNEIALQVLEESYTCNDDEKLKLIIPEIKKQRNYLIESLTPKPFFIKEVIDIEITDIFNEINRKISKENDPILQIISQFALELENNQYRVQKAIEEYSFVYGATVQQSTRIQQRLANKNSKITRLTDDYQTVIVDEAARANPGDLLIPLNKASQRIILVGDHRQLPHIYNDEIAEKVQIANSEIKVDTFEKTLFEHLYNVAKDMEQTDGIKRVITLNSQFRMHPLLGNFVSDNFYSEEVLGTDESFKSSLGEEFFRQNIFNSPANWIDVPIEKGDLQKSSKSYRRMSEVEVIVEKVKELLTDEEGKNLSIGVITFYSGQAKSIELVLGEELKDVVRVGTVDAFQGMEFDIIFLSTVRTSKNFDIHLAKDLTEINKKYAMKLYGFLMVKNRLCVAMSRQKKVLVVVGDARAFDNEISKKFTPALYNYLQLSKRESKENV